MARSLGTALWCSDIFHIPAKKHPWIFFTLLLTTLLLSTSVLLECQPCPVQFPCMPRDILAVVDFPSYVDPVSAMPIHAP